ncbi:MAG TPA: cation-translocating P-type ATPase [Phycisphaerae bacterium]|jgi:Cd2+/Zn2+-exporting ATPase|nr:cation-translocating P-type ATPase [Phycisphaerae bacterium]
MTAIAPQEDVTKQAEPSVQPPPGKPAEGNWTRHGQLICAAVAGVFILVAKIAGWLGAAALVVNLLVGVAFALGLYFGGKAAVESIRERKLDINLLMVLGAVLAIFVGSAAEGALLLFLFTLSGALEHYAMQRTHAALESLTKLFPKEAVVLADDGTQKKVPLAELRVGDRVLVKPGENISADGEVAEGSSAVDESAITGEFMPREKTRGMEVYAGTLNQAGRLVVRVTRPAQDTTLAKIIHLVSQASEEKAPVERLFDRVGSWYTAGVLLTSAAACLAMGFVFGVPWFSVHLPGGGVQTGAIYRAITLLIVASPCALILSAPVVILSAIASCARRGIILKGGRHLESLAALKAIVFDKTGTLTTGQVRMVGFDVVEVDAAPVPGGQQCAAPPRGADAATLRRTLLEAAASLEANSTHPLAVAVVRAAEAEGIARLPVEHFLQEAGAGLRGEVGGRPCVIGSPALVEGFCPTRTLEALGRRVNAAHAAGETAVVLFAGGHAAVMRFADTVRDAAPGVVRALHEQGMKPLIMLTGDHRKVAEAVGTRLGLDEVRAELLPEGKLHAVTELVQRHTHVGMIGDGINDAPALARSTVGIAMGSIGSDAAMQAADVVLLSDAIERLPWLIQTARKARRIMIQNLTFALGIIAILIGCSLLGIVGLPLGVVGHEGSTLLVVLNGLRLLLSGEKSQSRL